MTYFEGIPPEVKQVQQTGITRIERKKVEGTEKSEKTESADKVKVSGKTKGFAELLAIASAQPDVRTEKVQQLKQAVDGGTYSVDAEKIAGKIIDEIA